MPIYGYRCEQCGHELEVLQSMKDEPLRVCPNCMGPLRKMIYPVGIVFKGSGYYTTDYKSAGSPSRHGDSDAAASASGSSDGSSETAAKSGSSSESKGESKSESKGESRSDSGSESKSESKPAKEAAKSPSSAKPAAK
jgi:putative FmdB family regulatory protein